MTKRKYKHSIARKILPVDLIAARNLRVARLRANMTQAELASSIDIVPHQIQKYELARNRMSLSRAAQFAEILRISVADLVGDTGLNATGARPNFPDFARWLAIYDRAEAADILPRVFDIAEAIVSLYETKSD